MKIFLEEQTGTGENITISKIKEVSSLSNAIKDKTANKCFIHKCRHDENPQRACERIEI